MIKSVLTTTSEKKCRIVIVSQLRVWSRVKIGDHTMENVMLPDRKWALKHSSERWTELACLCGNIVVCVCVRHVFSHTYFISEHWFPTEPHMSQMCLCVWTLHGAALRFSLDNLLSCQLLYATHFLSGFHLLTHTQRSCHNKLWILIFCPM